MTGRFSVICLLTRGVADSPPSTTALSHTLELIGHLMGKRPTLYRIVHTFKQKRTPPDHRQPYMYILSTLWQAGRQFGATRPFYHASQGWSDAVNTHPVSQLDQMVEDANGPSTAGLCKPRRLRYHLDIGPTTLALGSSSFITKRKRFVEIKISLIVLATPCEPRYRAGQIEGAPRARIDIGPRGERRASNFKMLLYRLQASQLSLRGFRQGCDTESQPTMTLWSRMTLSISQQQPTCRQTGLGTAWGLHLKGTTPVWCLLTLCNHEEWVKVLHHVPTFKSISIYLEQSHPPPRPPMAMALC